MVCEAAQALGPSYTTHESPVPESEVSRTTKVSADLSKLDIDTLNTSLAGNYVRDVARKFTDAKAFEIADAKVLEARDSHVINNGCDEAMRRRVEANQPSTIVKSAIAGKFSYAATFATDVNADAKIALLEQLSPALGLRLEVSGSDQLKGDGLIWGLRDEEGLALELAGVESAGATIGGQHPKAASLLKGVGAAAASEDRAALLAVRTDLPKPAINTAPTKFPMAME